MRLFVGIDITDEIRGRFSDYMRRLEGLAPGTKWVKPESLHVTLKFIGYTEKLDDIKTALAVVKGSSFSLRFQGTGFFTQRSPRVFWVGIEAGAELAALARYIEQVLVPVGIAPEERKYSPHLTLAREGSGRPQGAREDRNKPKMYALKQRLEQEPRLAQMDFGTMQATEFILYQSETRPEGARYTKLARFPLP